VTLTDFVKDAASCRTALYPLRIGFITMGICRVALAHLELKIFCINM